MTPDPEPASPAAGEASKRELDFCERIDDILSCGNPQSCGKYPEVARLIAGHVAQATHALRERAERAEAEVETLKEQVDLWKTENESRAIAAREMHDVIGYDNTDGFHITPSPLEMLKTIKTKLRDAEERAKSQYVTLEACLKGVQDDAEEMGSSNIPVGYEELSPENVAIADACWRHGKDCMETAILNRLYDYFNERRTPLPNA